jgi:hypothetical protein
MTSNLKKGIISFVTAALLLCSNLATYATDIPIETYVEGGVTIDLKGEWETDLSMLTLSPYQLTAGSEDTRWEINSTSDYIAIADDTSTDGFYITFDFTDFIYSGPSQTQNDIAAANYTMIANYESGSAAAPNKGEDDPLKNLSILPDSCESTDTSDFSFHSDFEDSGEDYSLVASTTETTVLTGSNTCLAIVNFRIERTELTIPQNSEAGTYSSALTVAIYDGAP